MVSSRARLERTSAYSAITKNAFTSTSRPVRTMARAVTGAARSSPLCRRRYFGVDRRSFSDAWNASSPRGPSSQQPVDPLGHLEVGSGEAPGRMVGEREPDLVPPVDQDVGVVVGL